MRVKLRRSAGSGKWVTIVDGRSSSVKSYSETHQICKLVRTNQTHTFLYPDLCGARLGLLLCRRLLILLHGPYLIRGVRLVL